MTQDEAQTMLGELRDEHGLTYRELGELLGVTASWACMLTRGERTIGSQQLASLVQMRTAAGRRFVAARVRDMRKSRPARAANWGDDEVRALLAGSEDLEAVAAQLGRSVEACRSKLRRLGDG